MTSVFFSIGTFATVRMWQSSRNISSLDIYTGRPVINNDETLSHVILDCQKINIEHIMIMNINSDLQDVVKIPSHLSLLQIALRFVADSTQQQQLWKIKGKRHDYKNARFRSNRPIFNTIK